MALPGRTQRPESRPRRCRKSRICPVRFPARRGAPPPAGPRRRFRYRSCLRYGRICRTPSAPWSIRHIRAARTHSSSWICPCPARAGRSSTARRSTSHAPERAPASPLRPPSAPRGACDTQRAIHPPSWRCIRQSRIRRPPVPASAPAPHL